MKSPRILIVWLLSMTLLVAVVILCARSRHHADILGVYTPAGHLQAMASDRGGMLLVIGNVPFGKEKGLSADAMSMARDDFTTIHDYLFDPAKKPWSIIGFHFAHGTVSPWGWTFGALIVPYWALITVLSVLPARQLRRMWLTWRWRRQRRCGVCGYDLSHSTGRCPECGEARDDTVTCDM